MEQYWVVDCIQSNGKTCQMLCPGHWTTERFMIALNLILKRR